MTAILQTVPFFPSLVAVITIYIPEATRLPFLSQPSQVNVPPLLRPSWINNPLAETIFTSALKVRPEMVIGPV